MGGLLGFVLWKDRSDRKGDSGPEEEETETGRQQLAGGERWVLKSTASPKKVLGLKEEGCPLHMLLPLELPPGARPADAGGEIELGEQISLLSFLRTVPSLLGALGLCRFAQ